MDNQPEIQGNNLFDQQCQLTNGKIGRKTITASDIILNKYGGLTGQLRAMQILAMEIREKQLDKALPWFKLATATVFGIDTKHFFLFFQCQSQNQFVTVDYYEESRLLIRIGSLDMVLAANQSAQRLNSHIRQKKGVDQRHQFKKGTFSLGELIGFLVKMTLKPYKKIWYNGKKFSENVSSHIRNKLVLNNEIYVLH